MRKLAAVLSLACAVNLAATSVAVAQEEEEEPPVEVEVEFLELATGSALRPAVMTAMTATTSERASGTVTASSGPVKFFTNQELPCDTAIAGEFGCGQLLEPEAKSAPDGTIFVSAQEGAGGGVDVWRRDPRTFVYEQLPKIDPIPGTDDHGLTPGGGDNDLAFSTDGTVYVTSLYSLVTSSLARSEDGGDTWTNNELASSFVGTDRQWIAAYGPDTVYMTYHDIYVFNLWLTKSTDGGATFGPPMPLIPPEELPRFANTPGGAGNIHSNMITDPDGRVAMVVLASRDAVENVTPLEKAHDVFVIVTDENGENPELHLIHQGGVDQNFVGLFPAIASDRAGNLYASWTDLHGVFVSVSRDHGETWTKPMKVSTGKGNRATVFPFVVAGDAGRIGLAWLGSSAEGPEAEDAEWLTYFSSSTNALAKKPRYTQVVASDHVVREGPICLEGLACNPLDDTRNLAEVLQIGLTKDGRALIAYPDDSSEAHIAGWSWVAEQCSGPSLYARVKPRPPKPPRGITCGVPAGPQYRRVGRSSAYFLAGEDAGTGITDENGSELDSPGDEGVIGTKPGNEQHAASGNLWTTNFGGVPIAFTGPPARSTQLVGGNLSLTAFLQEPTAEAVLGSIQATLLDVAPNGEETLIAGGGGTYEAGVEITEAEYPFELRIPYELRRGHRLRVEIAFTCFCSTTLRFHYGSGEVPARLVYERFVRL